MKCKVCGKETTNPLFCSRSCAVTLNNKLHPKRKLSWDGRPCKWCGKLMTSFKHKTRMYCSFECYRAFLKDEVRKKIVAGEEHKSIQLQRYLIETRGNRCELCGFEGMWNGKPLRLQIDHIDGNHHNDTLKNIRLICPNCHTQTETWGTRNYKFKKNAVIVESVS